MNYVDWIITTDSLNWQRSKQVPSTSTAIVLKVYNLCKINHENVSDLQYNVMELHDSCTRCFPNTSKRDGASWLVHKVFPKHFETWNSITFLVTISVWIVKKKKIYDCTTSDLIHIFYAFLHILNILYISTIYFKLVMINCQSVIIT